MDILSSLVEPTTDRDNSAPARLNTAPMLIPMATPWSLRVADRAALSVVAVTRGSVYVDYGDTNYQLHVGDVALVRGTAPYTCGDTPDSPTVAAIDENGDCFDPTGTISVEDPMTVGLRTWGNCTLADADTVLLLGTYRDGDITRRIVESLDRFTVVGMAEDPLVEILAAEVVRNDLGQEAVLQRLLELILITALRRWLQSAEAKAPSWYRAHTDPVVGHALRLLHHNPAEAWTVPSLARACGVSRPVLARRFTDLLGEPPMSYLTRWRLSLAVDLLTTSELPLRSIAARVGYSSPFTFSTAFKRVHGTSPTDFRNAERRRIAATQGTPA